MKTYRRTRMKRGASAWWLCYILHSNYDPLMIIRIRGSISLAAPANRAPVDDAYGPLIFSLNPGLCKRKAKRTRAAHARHISARYFAKSPRRKCFTALRNARQMRVARFREIFRAWERERLKEKERERKRVKRAMFRWCPNACYKRYPPPRRGGEGAAVHGREREREVMETQLRTESSPIAYALIIDEDQWPERNDDTLMRIDDKLWHRSPTLSLDVARYRATLCITIIYRNTVNCDSFRPVPPPQ